MTAVAPAARTSAAAPLFPLPLTAFETYMEADNSPDHPMSFAIRLVFSGPLDREAFRRALGVAVGRHPLLGAHIVGQWPRLRWVAAEDPAPWLEFVPAGEPLRYPDGQAKIDLRTSTGLRVWAREEEAGTVDVRFQFHHATTDGIGAYHFLEDVLVAYHRQVEPAAGEELFRPLDPARLKRREACGLTWWGFLLRLPVELWGFVVGSLTFFLGRPATVARPAAPAIDDELRARVIDAPAVSFEGAEFKQLREAAKAARVTLNDWMLRDVFLALDRWNVRYEPRRKNPLLRLMIPFSLRVEGDEATPAANIVGMVHLDRWMRVYRNPRWLLTSLAWEMRFLKFFRFALSNVRICQVFCAVPGMLAFMIWYTQRCMTTGALSNMGILFTEARLPRQDGKLVAGKLVLERVESAPPVRYLSPISITTLTYGGRLSLVLNYDKYHLRAEDAAALCAEIGAQFRATLAAGPSSVR